MPACALDHIIVAAASLADGVRFVRDRLGVEIGPGGEHPKMGTHNRVMRIGEKCFFEVIAINPSAPPPGRPRWFALDDPAMGAELQKSPRLVAWAARAADIVATVQAAAVPIGVVVPLTRGELSWRLTIPADGQLPGGGVIPHLIEWDGGLRPWEDMADPGCRLEALILAHPDPAWLNDALRSICPKGFDLVSVVEGVTPVLSARIRRPDGVVVTI